MKSDRTDPPISVEQYYKKSHAIIIGISSYKEETSLPNAFHDAAAIKRVLEEKYHFNNVITLFNEEATGDKIREILQDTLRDESIIATQDRVLIYYSGHGKLRREVNWRGEETNTGYIIPYDSRLKRYGSSIEMDDLVKSCQGCNAKHILLVLDCCYSGYAATRTGEPTTPPEYLDENFLHDITQRKAIQVLAATQKDEPANDSGVLPGFSAFTGALLGILKNEKDPIENGVITASEIGAVLQQEVVNQKGVFQRPSYNVLAGSEGGDFIFKILPTAVKKLHTPVANAGVDQVVNAGTLVTLDGTRSKDPEDKPLQYSWIQIGGKPTVTLNEANTQTPTFTAPNMSEDTTYEIKLTVTNESGVSSYDGVNVTVKPIPYPKPRPILPSKPWFSPKIILPIVAAVAVASIAIAITIFDGTNSLPVANAGPNRTVNPGKSITSIYLDGTASKDPDDDPLTYSWVQTAGPNITLNNAKTSTPSFVAPKVPPDATLVFNLAAKDDKGATSNDFVTVDVIGESKKELPNHPPIANNQTITTSVDKPVNITLTAYDPEINESITAAIVSQPSDGRLGEINQTTGNVTYTPNSGFSGTDEFTFKVNDRKVDSDKNGTVKITVNQLSETINHPPIANNQTITTSVDKPVNIRLTAYDPELNDNLTAALVSRPLHGALSEINQDTGNVTYTPNPEFVGKDRFIIKANDGKVDSNNPGTVAITVNKPQR
jgi:hypothetical protein